MKKINFLAPISARVKDMEDYRDVIRSQINVIQHTKGLSNVSPELRKEMEKLFKMTSGMYLMDSFEVNKND